MKLLVQIRIWLMLVLMMSSQVAMAESVTMNFKNADIRAFIEFVSSFSGKNFLVDNRVKGSVTIVSPTAITEDEAYEVFLSVLEVNGFATVNSGSVIKIVPRAEGKQKAVTVRESGRAPNTDEVMTQVLRLKYADAQQLVALLRPLISPNSHLVAYPRGNMLLLTDSASNIRRIQGVLKLVDRQDAVGVQMFPLKHASADKLAKTLSGLYAKAGPGSPNSIKALSHQPGNILIVVAAPQMINEVSAIVQKLDIQPKPDSGRLQVRYLKHANAVDVAKVINELVGAGGSAATKPGASGKSLFSGDVKMVADPATNALLITADPSDMNSINGIIDKLDIHRLQVLVEALIVEVSAGVGEQFGIEWNSANNLTGSGTNAFGGTSFTNQAGTSINTVAANPLAAGSGLAVGVAKGSFTFGGQTILNLGALARALATKTDTNILSTPNILTMDNEEAEIIVGQNVPFLTGQSSTSGGVTNPFQTIERKDVGLTLRVKPQISEGNTVRLELYQEISSVDGGSAAEGGLTTSKRSIKTVVLANDGGMIVLGGLIRDDSSVSVQRVPCLGSIPLVGEAFKFTENKQTKTNLMVFLRPHIVKNESDIRALTNRKYNDIKGLYEKPMSGGTILFPLQDPTMPVSFEPKKESNGVSEPMLVKPKAPALMPEETLKPVNSEQKDDQVPKEVEHTKVDEIAQAEVNVMQPETDISEVGVADTDVSPMSEIPKEVVLEPVMPQVPMINEVAPEVVQPDEKVLEPQALSSKYHLQVGSFKSQKNAEVLVVKLKAMGVPSALDQFKTKSDETWFVVYSASYPNKVAASKVQADIAKTLNIKAKLTKDK